MFTNTNSMFILLYSHSILYDSKTLIAREKKQKTAALKQL